MMRIKLTDKVIASPKLKAPHASGKPTIYWDEDLKGFGLLLSGKTNTRTYIVQRDLRDGRTRRMSVGPANVLPLEKARDDAVELLRDLVRGIDPKARRVKDITLQEVLNQYLTANKQLRPKTAEDYRNVVERYLEPWLNQPLRSITPEAVSKRHLAIQKQVMNGQRYKGEATANSTMRALRTLWNFAAERIPDLPRNPTSLMRKQWFPIARRQRRVKNSDLAKFYAAVSKLPNQNHRRYLTLLLFTGLRRTEAASLKWDDIDFEDCLIRLPAERTKSKRKLNLPMTDFVFELLDTHRKLGKEKSSFVFPSDSEAGHLIEPKFPLTLVKEETGIHISAHDLRRTFITIAESTDISPLALKALVNHSLGDDVTSGYVQMTTERLREPAQRVCDRIKQLCKISPKS
jgi:integrase